MRLILIICIVICFTSQASADGPAFIKVGRSTVLVYELPDSLSTVVDTIRAEDFFFYERKENSEWVNIWRPYHGKEGYMRFTELQDVMHMDVHFQREIIINRLAELDSQFAIYERAREEGDSATRFRAYRVMETSLQSVYLPLLYFIPEYFNITSDTTILKPFFNILWANRGSASEMQLCAAGLCYWYHPEITIKSLQSMRGTEAFYSIGSAISGGLELCVCSESLKSEDQAQCKKLQSDLEAVLKE